MVSRNTIQKNLIMEAVQHLDHPTADEVYTAVTRQHPSVSKGTVYRNLNVLVEQGGLRKVPVPDGADRFDITLREHYHVRCRICGRMADVTPPMESEWVKGLTNSQGFIIEEHDILLRGLCPDCAHKQV